MSTLDARRAIWLGLSVGISIGLAAFVLLGGASAKPAAASVQEASQGWQTAYSETFDAGISPGWLVSDTSTADGGRYTWGAEPFTPTSPITAAWCVGGGADGISLTAGLDQYPASVDTWLLSRPIELSAVWDAYVRFRWWLETDLAAHGRGANVALQSVEQVSSPPEEGDWFGWCVLTDTADMESAQCTYLSGGVGAWMNGAIPLGAHLPVSKGVTNTVRIAFHFVSDDDGAAGRGAFVDDVAFRVNRGHSAWLPLVQRDFEQVPVPTNLLENSGFGVDWTEGMSHEILILPETGDPYTTEVGNVFTPVDWLVWCRVDDGHSLVEVGDAWDGEHGGDSYRVVSPPKAVKMFKTDAPWQAGLMQQVSVTPGQRYRFTIMAHAWSNHNDAGAIPGHEACVGDARCSWGVGTGGYFAREGEAPPLNGDPWNDAVHNFTFWVGIDPTGGTDPDAGTVIWGQPGAHIYNEHYQVPAVEAQAVSDTVTVFTKANARWGFRNNDAYWDDAELIAVGGGDDDGDEIEWTYPVIEEGSKIGVHSILADGVGGFAQTLVDAGARFPVVKGVDDLGWLPGVKEISPDSIVIARLKVPNEGCSGVEDPGFDLQAHARASLDVILAKIDSDPRLEDVVDYWEVYNEPDPPGTEGYRRLAELMVETMDLAEDDGLKIAIFSLNAGTPEWDEMQAMVATGVFSQARQGGHILALHEGTFSSHDPTECWGWTIPGSPVVGGAGCLNFRYRYLYHLLKQRGEVVPLVVSEWYCGDEKSASTETLVNALKWYDGEASKDYYFWATCPFTLGPTSGWKHTDYQRVYEGGLVDYMIEIKDRENATPPGPSQAGGLPAGLRDR